MDTTEKVETFRHELDFITNESIREFTEKCIADLPDYFFIVPASSTGKYHPSYALGEGGLVRHVKVVFKVAVELFRMEMFEFSNLDRDRIVAAILLHDGRKSGEVQQTYTVPEHPRLEVEAILKNTTATDLISEETLFVICGNIASHMGQWNTDHDGKVINPKPLTNSQQFVHLCDYIASRKFFEVNFNV